MPGLALFNPRRSLADTPFTITPSSLHPRIPLGSIADSSATPLAPRRLHPALAAAAAFARVLSAGMSPIVGCNGAVPVANGAKAPVAFKIFVGYDPREDVAYDVCRWSIQKRASIPVEVIPINQSELRAAGLFWRERGPTESTEFSFTRFLTPYLAGYQGWAMFVDCDFLYLADVAELAALTDDRYAVMCVHHEYAPKETRKMDGAIQTVYPRKNWSSMVLYNCGHPKNVEALTPEAVSTRTGAFLHRFQWLDDAEIGEVPFVWNFLVGHNKVVEGDPKTYPKAIHYTSGGPWFEAYKDCEFAELWVQELEVLKKEEASTKMKETVAAQEEGVKPFPVVQASVV